MHYRSAVGISRTVCSEQAVPTVTLRADLPVDRTIEPPSGRRHPLTVDGAAAISATSSRLFLDERFAPGRHPADPDSLERVCFAAAP